MKYTFSFILALFALLLLSSCHKGESDAEGQSYEITARFEVDSTLILDNMVLYTDNHAKLQADSILLSYDLSFSHIGHTSGIDEIYLCTDGGELCRFYATEGASVDFLIKKDDDTLCVSFDSSKLDTINPWLQEKQELIESMTGADGHAILDSLCHEYPSDVRNTLLLRDNIDAERDSLFVRRCLGALNDVAKPSWLVKSIDQMLGKTSDFITRNKRLAGCTFQLDSTLFDLSKTRSEYLIIYCWADYSQSSIDSLKLLNRLINDEYDMKRLKLLSCCLSAPDSLWWKEKVADLEGIHVWLPAGFSDKRIYAWHVDQMPTLIFCDMYNNQQHRNIWGNKLRDALARVPNKSGYTQTNNNKSNGRPNNLSRPSRH